MEYWVRLPCSLVGPNGIIGSLEDIQGELFKVCLTGHLIYDRIFVGICRFRLAMAVMSLAKLLMNVATLTSSSLSINALVNALHSALAL